MTSNSKLSRFRAKTKERIEHVLFAGCLSIISDFECQQRQRVNSALFLLLFQILFFSVAPQSIHRLFCDFFKKVLLPQPNS